MGFRQRPTYLDVSCAPHGLSQTGSCMDERRSVLLASHRRRRRRTRHVRQAWKARHLSQPLAGGCGAMSKIQHRDRCGTDARPRKYVRSTLNSCSCVGGGQFDSVGVHASQLGRGGTLWLSGSIRLLDAVPHVWGKKSRWREGAPGTTPCFQSAGREPS